MRVYARSCVPLYAKTTSTPTLADCAIVTSNTCPNLGEITVVESFPIYSNRFEHSPFSPSYKPIQIATTTAFKVLAKPSVALFQLSHHQQSNHPLRPNRIDAGTAKIPTWAVLVSNSIVTAFQQALPDMMLSVYHQTQNCIHSYRRQDPPRRAMQVSTTSYSLNA